MRRTKTELLTKAAVGYLVKKGYGVTCEIGIIPWGRRRVDVFGMTQSGSIHICEIKSCVMDYTTDKKWHTYLDYCNKFTFVMCPETWELTRSSITDRRVGVLVLDNKTGYLKSVKTAKTLVMDQTKKSNLILRMAWRGATFSKRNTRRTKVFLS